MQIVGFPIGGSNACMYYSSINLLYSKILHFCKCFYRLTKRKITIVCFFRYYELEAVYGKLDPLVHVDLTPQNIIQLVVGWFILVYAIYMYRDVFQL